MVINLVVAFLKLGSEESSGESQAWGEYFRAQILRVSVLTLDPPCSPTTRTGSSLTLRDPRKTEGDKQESRGQSHWIKIQIARRLVESHPSPYFSYVQ